MTDFGLFPGDRFCRGHAWAWLVEHAVEGGIEVSVRGLAEAWRWPPTSVHDFLARLADRGMVRVETARGRTGRTFLTICTQTEILAPSEKSEHSEHLAKPSPHVPVTEALEVYRMAADRRGWPQVSTVSKARRSKLEARLREVGLDGWKEMLRKAMKSPLLCGDNDRGWKPTGIDWFTNATNFAKVAEGAYLPTDKPKADATDAASSVARAILARRG